MRGEGSIAALLAATVVLAALSAGAAAPRGQHLTQASSGAFRTTGAAEEPVGPQGSGAVRRYSPATHQGHWVKRRQLAQNTAASSILVQRMVADMQGQQAQQRQAYEDNNSSPAGQAQSPDQQPSPGFNASGTVREQAPSPRQQPSQGDNNSHMQRGQAPSPQQQPYQGDSYTTAAPGQTQTPQQQTYQGPDSSPAAPMQTQPPQQLPDQGYDNTGAESVQGQSPLPSAASPG